MRRMLPVLMPLVAKTGSFEKVMRREQSYVIDWNAPVNERAELALA